MTTPTNVELPRPTPMQLRTSKLMRSDPKNPLELPVRKIYNRLYERKSQMAQEITGQESPGLTIDAEIRNAFPVSTTSNRWIIIGDIYNDSRGRFNDGHPIRTTAVEEFFPPNVFRTKNTTYRVEFLANANWSQEALKAFPGAIKNG